MTTSMGYAGSTTMAAMAAMERWPDKPAARLSLRRVVAASVLLVLGMSSLACDGGAATAQERTRFNLLPTLEHQRSLANIVDPGDAARRTLLGEGLVRANDARRRLLRLDARSARHPPVAGTQAEERAGAGGSKWMPAPAIERQVLEVRLNGTSLGQHKLSAGWQRLALPLAAELVRPGANEVELIADQEHENNTGRRRTLAAAFGRVQLARSSGVRRTSIPTALEAAADAHSTRSWSTGSAVQIPLWAHPGSQLELTLRAGAARSFAACASARRRA